MTTGWLIDAGLRATAQRQGKPVPTRQEPERALPTNRFPGTCSVCHTRVEAEAGQRLGRGEDGRWLVRHLPGACPEGKPIPQLPKRDAYEPAKGDVHVIDGTYFRVHVSQSSGKPYGAVWNGNKFVGAIHDDRARGSLRRMCEATLATAEQAAAFGKMHHRCCFCSTPIDTPESEAVGYGPKCAGDRGLPWGQA